MALRNTLDFRPATVDVVARPGSAPTWRIIITDEAIVPGTIACTVGDQTPVVDTTDSATGMLVADITLTDEQTTALGTSPADWSFTNTLGGVPTCWVTGTYTGSYAGNTSAGLRSHVTSTSARVDVDVLVSTSAATALAAHLIDPSGAHAASAVSLADSGAHYAGATVEAALAEVPDLIDDALAALDLDAMFAAAPTFPWAQRQSSDPATTYYVSTITGNDSTGDGTSGTPYATIDRALTAAASTDCTILVRAPGTNPIVDYTPHSNNNNVVIDAWDYGEPWQHNGMGTSTSGWVHAGGGVYTKTTSRTTVCVVVPSLTETVGDRTFWQMLEQNTGTPTTPAAGQFGYASNVLYIHLPGDADPNSHTVMHPTTTTNVGAIVKSGSGTMTIRNARFIAGNLEHVTASAGTLILESVEGVYCGTNGGFQCTSTATMRCTNVRSWRSFNDGFNIKNSSVCTLVDCDGSYNDDEGASPHETSTLTISGGVYSHNGSAGATAVDSAAMHINRRPVFAYNQRSGVNAGEGAVTYYAATNSGRLSSARCLHNSGPGIVVKSGASVTRVDTDIVSGVATGNAQADNYAA